MSYIHLELPYTVERISQNQAMPFIVRVAHAVKNIQRKKRGNYLRSTQATKEYIDIEALRPWFTYSDQLVGRKSSGRWYRVPHTKIDIICLKRRLYIENNGRRLMFTANSRFSFVYYYRCELGVVSTNKLIQIAYSEHLARVLTV